MQNDESTVAAPSAVAADAPPPSRRTVMLRLWWRIAHTSGATLLSVLASVAALVITARILGPAGRGLYAAAISWVTLFATLGSLSLGPVIIHHAAGRAREEWLGSVAGVATVVPLLAAVCGWIVLAVLYAASHGSIFNHLSPFLIALAFLALPFQLIGDTYRHVLTAMGAVPVSNRIQVVSALASVVALAILVGLARTGVPGAVIANVVGGVTIAFISVRYVLRHAGGWRFDTSLAGRLLKKSAQFHANAVGNYLFAQATVLVLNGYRSPAETGYYQLAMQLFGLSLVVSNAVGVIAMELVAVKGADGAWPEQRRLILHATLAIAVISAVGYVAAPIGVTLVAGKAFLPAVRLFRILLPALLGATFSAIMASQWIGRGLFWQAAVVTLLTGMISISLDFVFVPRYGMTGGLVSTLVTYGISTVGNGLMALWVQGRWARSASAVRHSAVRSPMTVVAP